MPRSWNCPIGDAMPRRELVLSGYQGMWLCDVRLAGDDAGGAKRIRWIPQAASPGGVLDATILRICTILRQRGNGDCLPVTNSARPCRPRGMSVYWPSPTGNSEKWRATLVKTSLNLKNLRLNLFFSSLAFAVKYFRPKELRERKCIRATIPCQPQRFGPALGRLQCIRATIPCQPQPRRRRRPAS